MNIHQATDLNSVIMLVVIGLVIGGICKLVKLGEGEQDVEL